VKCGVCGRAVPLYRLPHPPGREDHYGLVSRQADFRRVGGLWISSLADRFTRRQLSAPKAQLSRMGLDLCQALETALDLPVYLFLPCPAGLPGCCPRCGAPWQAAENPHRSKTRRTRTSLRRVFLWIIHCAIRKNSHAAAVSAAALQVRASIRKGNGCT